MYRVKIYYMSGDHTTTRNKKSIAHIYLYWTTYQDFVVTGLFAMFKV